MDLDLRAVQRGHPAGGSLSLGGLIDRAGEEIYLDLKQYWDLDLADFLAGETNSSPRLVLALIRGLPEDSRWARHLREELDGEALSVMQELVDEEAEAAHDAEFWTPDRLLMATLINAVHLNTQATGHWEKGKVPQLPTVGPKTWQAQQTKAAAPEPDSGEDLLTFHLSRLGMPAGGGRTRL